MHLRVGQQLVDCYECFDTRCAWLLV